jgi:predicted choloylglycine hydrolase
LVVRYLLETCGSTAEAIEVLGRVPVYMPYTFTVVDAKGAFTTAFVGPDRPARFVTRRASANHQGEIEWPAYTRQVKSEQRLAKLESFLESTTDVPAAIDAFLKPPLWRRDYARGSGTLYFAAYRPSTGSLTMHWPGGSEAIGRSGDDERFFEIPLIEPTLK